MPPKRKKVFVPKTTIPPTPTYMRKAGKAGSRKMAVWTLCTTTVFGGRKTFGYKPDEHAELDRLIEQAADPDLRVALVSLALPPVSHCFIIMKLPNELRVYDVQNHYAESGLVPTHYTDEANEMADSRGYRYFVNGLLDRLLMPKICLRLMQSPELSAECWEMIDHSAESERPLPGDSRGACLLWCDAVLNRHWRAMLDEAYPDG